MGYEAYVTIAVILIAFVLFITEYFRIDHIAICIMVVLVLTGVLSPEDGVKGFANPATITVASMFVLSDALLRTGVIDSLTPILIRMIRKSYSLSVAGLVGLIGSMSAFVNNTPIVATFIPIVTNASQKTKIPASKLLIPLSYGAIFGGICTLIGTSTNILVSGIAITYGIDEINMFTMAPMGIILFVCGISYLLIFSKKLLPSHSSGIDTGGINLKNYLTEIKITQEKKRNGERITIDNLFKQDGMEVYVESIQRGEDIIKNPPRNFVLHLRDHLLVRGEMEKIKNLLKNESLLISNKLGTRNFQEEETKLTEIILLPNSELINKKLDDTDFFQKYRSKVVAIRQRGKQQVDNLNKIYLRAGDIILIQTDSKGSELLESSERKHRAPFVSLGQTGIQKVDKKQLTITCLIILSVIILAATGLVDIMIAALGGIALLLFSNHTTPENAYQAIDWRVVVLLAGSLSLGEAMQQSGLSEILATWLVQNIGHTLGPVAVISVLYLITVLLTEVMSNNATAALLTPIAISIAISFDVNVLPFLMCIAFAASASFMTPIGYQTNTMVYSAGNYKFKDFLRIGSPLSILFWILATFLIPIIYPL